MFLKANGNSRNNARVGVSRPGMAAGLKLKASFGAQSQAELLADATPDAQRALVRAIRDAMDEDILATAHFSRALPVCYRLYKSDTRWRRTPMEAVKDEGPVKAPRCLV